MEESEAGVSLSAIRELRALKEIDHPHVVKVIAFVAFRSSRTARENVQDEKEPLHCVRVSRNRLV